MKTYGPPAWSPSPTVVWIPDSTPIRLGLFGRGGKTQALRDLGLTPTPPDPASGLKSEGVPGDELARGTCPRCCPEPCVRGRGSWCPF